MVIFFIFLFLFLAVNRRLDEWVKLDQLDLESVEAVVDEKVEEKVMIILQIVCFHLFWTVYFFYLRDAYKCFFRKKTLFTP